ncbi:MAG TPA: hypothetical protein VMD59_08930 [Acidimicrobiales bacterium]|nr:hypothetical protein [Acidimicrobiales bacterium]
MVARVRPAVAAAAVVVPAAAVPAAAVPAVVVPAVVAPAEGPAAACSSSGRGRPAGSGVVALRRTVAATS